MTDKDKYKDQIIKDNYVIIDDFISVERANSLYDALKKDYKTAPQMFMRDDPQAPKSMSIYNWRWFVEILVERIPFISMVMNDQVLPTYSYARIYAEGEELKRHYDRDACEVSVTVHLKDDGVEWPIYIVRPDGEEVEVKLKQGQALIYLGAIAPHWRNVYEGKEYVQVFLHYVRSRGKYWQYYFDRRN